MERKEKYKIQISLIKFLILVLLIIKIFFLKTKNFINLLITNEFLNALNTDYNF